LPHLVNPERGYIVTTNNIVIDDSYIHTIHGAFIMDARARALEMEIEKQIKTGKKIDDKFILEKLINNINDPYCPDMLKYFTELLKYDTKLFKKISDNPVFKNFFKFDCQMKGDSKEALLFNVIEQEFYYLLNYEFEVTNEKYKYINHHILNAEEKINYLIMKLKEYLEDPHTCKNEYNMSCSALVDKVVSKALEFITVKLGTNEDNWKWNNLNYKTYPHKPFTFIPGLRQLANHTYKADVIFIFLF
jgi:acyl-homoserine lactone acylase PvdQ